MRKTVFWLGLGLAVIAAGVVAAQREMPNDLIVHEWGTFLAMSGSDGVTLDGMYHEEHALPAFVHARSKDQLRLRSVVLKGETPVIYFYTDRAQKVRVDVRFPRGLWTQWYPQAQIVGPQFSQVKTPMTLRDGRIRWCAEVIPPHGEAPDPTLPETSSDALWNYARDVDAAFVRTVDGTKEPGRPEYERFLFYRGLGEAPLPVRLTAESGGTLESAPEARDGIRHVFLVRVEGGRGVYAYRPALRPGERATGVIPSMDGSNPLGEMTRDLADDLAARLVESGLYPKEARAMVNTWRTSYFQTEGIRALFVLPQRFTDEFIPIEVSPKPKELVRVMVGRIELLSPERERLAEKAVRELASPDEETRLRSFEYLRDQGRYVEPIVRRIRGTASDPAMRTLCDRLLATDFVTDLRAAIHAAADGGRVAEDSAFLRAQLASLLRQLGLDAEAKAEGERALAALREKPEPPITHHDARGYLRAAARASEGIGDDRKTAEAYSRFLQFGSRVATARDCRGCHADAGPREMSWFRDWWAGERYALFAGRTGGLDSAIRAQETSLAKGSDLATRMRLYYLYQAKGQEDRATTMWTSILETEEDARALADSGTPGPRRSE
jgi:hypothetical protein